MLSLPPPLALAYPLAPLLSHPPPPAQARAIGHMDWHDVRGTAPRPATRVLLAGRDQGQGRGWGRPYAPEPIEGTSPRRRTSIAPVAGPGAGTLHAADIRGAMPGERRWSTVTVAARKMTVGWRTMTVAECVKNVTRPTHNSH
jgi:hypothetical protein